MNSNLNKNAWLELFESPTIVYGWRVAMQTQYTLDYLAFAETRFIDAWNLKKTNLFIE